MTQRTDEPLTVLVVDDDPMIRMLLERRLPAFGFTVLTATHGGEALDVYQNDGDAIAVVLLDVQMPEMDGPQAVFALRQLNPAVSCCFMASCRSPAAWGCPPRGDDTIPPCLA